MFVRSPRLFLRPSFPEDAAELFAAISDEEIVRNLARAPWPYTPEDADDFVRCVQDPRLPHFLITMPGTWGARIVGGVGLGGQGDDVELGYWVSRDHWGQGLATEAASAVLRIAPILGHRRIVASHFSDNPASGGVLRKLGFQPTGRIVDRFSKGRDAVAPTLEYALDIDMPCGSGPESGPPQRRSPPLSGNDQGGEMSIAA